jgi:hypothetical protein
VHCGKPCGSTTDDGDGYSDGYRSLIVDNSHVLFYQERSDVKTKTKTVRFRISPKDWNRVLMLAAMYADGNASEWIRHAIVEAPRKVLRR